MAFLSVEALSKTYLPGTPGEVIALRDVSFSLEKGRFYVIYGPSGAGKSTLLNLIGAMDSPTIGHVRMEGEDISSLNEKQKAAYRRDKVGFVFQFYSLFQKLNALENIQLAASLSKDPLDPVKMIEAVGLKDRKLSYPRELSGGEQQRVAIARAIVKKPLLLLADEPTGALDSKTGGEVLALLSSLCKREGITVLLSTHNEKIASCADAVLRLNDGVISPMEYNDHPIDPKDIEW